MKGILSKAWLRSPAARWLVAGGALLVMVAVAVLAVCARGILVDAPSPNIPSQRALLRPQAAETWKRLQVIVAPCDQAVNAVAEVSPPITDYRASAEPAREAGIRCRHAGLQLLALRPPPMLEAASSGAIGRALDQCQYLYVIQGNAHARLAVALDEASGAISPDQRGLFDAWADVQEANINVHGCRSGFLLAARQAGLPMTLFETRAPERAVVAFARMVR